MVFIDINQQRMGQSQNPKKIQQDYNIIRKREDGSFLLRHKLTQNEYLLRNFASNMEDEVNGLMELLKKREKIKNMHILDLIEMKKKDQSSGCSSLTKMYLLIEYPFKNLADQIQQRQPKSDYFAQDELWSILYSCCVGLNTLYSNKIAHECLSLKQIYINKSGVIQISDPLLLGLEKNYILLLKKNSTQYVHVSPEVMNFLDDCNFSFYDKDKSDIFVLGVLMLEAAILKEIRLYDKKKKRPHLNVLNDCLNQAKTRYSQTFTNTLAQMLQLHLKMRPSFNEIIERISRDYEINSESSLIKKQSINNYSIREQSIPKLQLSNGEKPVQHVAMHPAVQHVPIPPAVQTNKFIQEENVISGKFYQQDLIKMIDVQQRNPTSHHESPIVSSGRNQNAIQSPIISPQRFRIEPLQLSSGKPKLMNKFPIDSASSKKPEPEMHQTKSLKEFNLNPFQKNKARPFIQSKKKVVPEEPKYVCQLLEGGGRYEGFKEFGKKNGKGTLYFKDGGCYDGTWEDDHMHGYGLLFYSTGQLAYEGEWIEDEFYGKGRVYNDKPQKYLQPFDYTDFAGLGDRWLYYQGDFESDSKHGKGKIQLTNGQSFDGAFVNDSIEGEGTYHPMNNRPVNGVWKDNMLVKM